MSDRIERCKCGHDKTTHFDDRYTCLGILGMLCDCKAYGVPGALEPVVPPPYVRPHSSWCTCSDCMGVPTPRIAIGGRPHTDMHCSCKACLDWMFAP